MNLFRCEFCGEIIDPENDHTCVYGTNVGKWSKWRERKMTIKGGENCSGCYDRIKHGRKVFMRSRNLLYNRRETEFACNEICIDQIKVRSGETDPLPPIN